jgi:hypothetical protein
MVGGRMRPVQSNVFIPIRASVRTDNSDYIEHNEEEHEARPSRWDTRMWLSLMGGCGGPGARGAFLFLF